MNTPRTKPFASKAERTPRPRPGCLPIRSASFVSILVDAGVCRARGLPEADYFLWNDDFEFTTRLLRGQAGLLCPASVVVHKTADVRLDRRRSGQRFFYEVRNKVWTLRTGSPLAPAERLLYGGSTLRRWARTFAKSSDRGTLRSCLITGLAAGLRTSPRPTEEVLASAGLAVPGTARTRLSPAPGRPGQAPALQAWLPAGLIRFPPGCPAPAGLRLPGAVPAG